MAVGFDPYDRASWDFGRLNRDEAANLLGTEEEGIFLVRHSATSAGDYVLSVRENARESGMSHYIINRTRSADGSGDCYTIANRTFADLPTLLNYYKNNMLESSALIRPVQRTIELYRAKYDFSAYDPTTDLPFRKGEILSVIRKWYGNSGINDDEWWLARNEAGQEGLIPHNYVEPYCGETRPTETRPEPQSPSTSSDKSSDGTQTRATNSERKPPAWGQVIKARQPNAYDMTALRLQIGDKIRILKMDSSGKWEGELNGKYGHFPFTYVEILDDPALPLSSPSSSSINDLSVASPSALSHGSATSPVPRSPVSIGSNSIHATPPGSRPVSDNSSGNPRNSGNSPVPSTTTTSAGAKVSVSVQNGHLNSPPPGAMGDTGPVSPRSASAVPPPTLPKPNVNISAALKAMNGLQQSGSPGL